MTTKIDGLTGVDLIKDGTVVQQDLAAPYYLPKPQTWQNMLGSRVAGQNYVNNTSQPISVSIQVGATSAAVTAATLSVDGLILDSVYPVQNTSTWCLKGVIPVGSAYVVNFPIGTPYLSTWNELRE